LSYAQEALLPRDAFAWGWGLACGRWGSFFAALLEAVAVAVHLQYVNVVGETVEQSSGEALRSEDLGPLLEWQVAGYQRRTPLVALTEDLEEQFSAGL
jgi:hypothetical protein